MSARLRLVPCLVLFVLVLAYAAFLAACDTQEKAQEWSPERQKEYAAAMQTEDARAALTTEARNRADAAKTAAAAAAAPGRAAKVEPPPTPTSTEAPKDLIISDTGIDENGSDISYWFTIKNPNDDYAAHDVSYQEELIDTAGDNIERRNDTISLLLPGQSRYLPASAYRAGQTPAPPPPAEVQVKASVGRWEKTEVQNELLVHELAILYGAAGYGVTGWVKNDYEVAVHYAIVSVVGYAADGKPTGSSSTVASFIPAGGQAPFSAPLGSIKPERVEASASIQDLAEVSSPPLAPLPYLLEVASQSFGQDGEQLVYELGVENTNAGQAARNVEYIAAFYDEGGKMVATNGGQLSIILPGQKVSAVGVVRPPTGTKVGKMETMIDARSFAPTEEKFGFTAEKLDLVGGETRSQLTGYLKSTAEHDLNGVSAVALAYSASGALVGAGEDRNLTVPKGAAVPVSFNMTLVGTPSRFVVSAAPAYLEGVSPAAVTLAPAPGVNGLAFNQADERLSVGFVVQNSSATEAQRNVSFRVAAIGADGGVLDVQPREVRVLLPGEKLGIFETFNLPSKGRIDHVEVNCGGGTVIPSVKLAPLQVTGVAFKPANNRDIATATVKNPNSQAVNSVNVSALAYDKAGTLVGGGKSSVQTVPAGGEAPANIIMQVRGTVDRVEVYAGLDWIE